MLLLPIVFVLVKYRRNPSRRIVCEHTPPTSDYVDFTLTKHNKQTKHETGSPPKINWVISCFSISRTNTSKQMRANGAMLMLGVGADCRKMSVRPSVRLSHAGILLRRLNILSNIFHLRVANHALLVFFHTKRDGNWQYSGGNWRHS